MAEKERRYLGGSRMEGAEPEERMEDWFKEGGTTNEFEEGEVVRGRAQSFLVDIGEDDSCARLGEGMHSREAHARAPTRDERDLAGEVIRRVHGCFLSWMDVVLLGGRQSERGLIRT